MRTVVVVPGIRNPPSIFFKASETKPISCTGFFSVVLWNIL